MSPVSRDRKTKKQTQKKRRDLPRLTVFQDDRPRIAPQPARRHGTWFDAATERVLGGTGALLTASNPREIEQRTAELLGSEMHGVITAETGDIYFEEWFEALAEAAAATGDEASSRLLQGMSMLAPVSVRRHVDRAADRIFPQPKAIGDVWKLTDMYGSRFGLLASYEYPGEDLPVIFLFDTEAGSIPVQFITPGLYEKFPDAVAAWRSAVGDTAGESEPEPELVEQDEDLEPLAQVISERDYVMGTETRATMDNWFRAARRIEELADARMDRGDSFPSPQYLYHNFDAGPLVGEFAAWYNARHGGQPDLPATAALAEDWLEGVLPQVWHSVSPARVDAQLAMFKDDWIPDDPMTPIARALFPDWVRWHGEQSGLPEHLIDRAADMATEGVGRMT
jgi:hypothetical protein